MSIAALIPCYGTTDYLAMVLKHYSHLDKILVMNYLYPQSLPFEDDTKAICDRFGVECLSGSGLNQEDVLNLGISKLQDYDNILISDADELITRDDLAKILKVAGKGGTVSCPLRDYIDNLDTAFEQRTHCPVVMVGPRSRFYQVRNVVDSPTQCLDALVHHFGFMFSEDKVNWKQNKQIKTNGGEFGKLFGRKKVSVVAPQEIKDALAFSPPLR